MGLLMNSSLCFFRYSFLVSNPSRKTCRQPSQQDCCIVRAKVRQDDSIFFSYISSSVCCYSGGVEGKSTLPHDDSRYPETPVASGWDSLHPKTFGSTVILSTNCYCHRGRRFQDTPGTRTGGKNVVDARSS